MQPRPCNYCRTVKNSSARLNMKIVYSQKAILQASIVQDNRKNRLQQQGQGAAKNNQPCTGTAVTVTARCCCGYWHYPYVNYCLCGNNSTVIMLHLHPCSKLAVKDRTSSVTSLNRVWNKTKKLGYNSYKSSNTRDNNAMMRRFIETRLGNRIQYLSRPSFEGSGVGSHSRTLQASATWRKGF